MVQANCLHSKQIFVHRALKCKLFLFPSLPFSSLSLRNCQCVYFSLFECKLYLQNNRTKGNINKNTCEHGGEMRDGFKSKNWESYTFQDPIHSRLD